MKKIMSIVLSVCLVVIMSVPAFAYSSSDVMKVQLSDQAMTEAVGGTYGPINVTINSATAGQVKGTIANKDTRFACNYTIWSGLNDLNQGGTIVQTGTVAKGTTKTFSASVSTGWFTRVTCEDANHEPVMTAAAGAFVQ
jgi:hypothetical protein